jgi:hypothetical protein
MVDLFAFINSFHYNYILTKNTKTDGYKVSEWSVYQRMSEINEYGHGRPTQ